MKCDCVLVRTQNSLKTFATRKSHHNSVSQLNSQLTRLDCGVWSQSLRHPVVDSPILLSVKDSARPGARFRTLDAHRPHPTFGHPLEVCGGIAIFIAFRNTAHRTDKKQPNAPNKQDGLKMDEGVQNMLTSVRRQPDPRRQTNLRSSHSRV